MHSHLIRKLGRIMIKHTLLFINLFIAVAFSQAIPSPFQFSFEKFPFPEKLPSNSVIRIYHDKEGYMWFGTKDGLCRFDGYDVKVFRSSALTPGKLTSNEIQCITEDNNQQLWVGTFEGINVVNKKNYIIKPLDNKYVKKDRIGSIITDSKGYIWIGTSTNGVIRMDPKTGKYDHYSTNKDALLQLRSNSVTNIYEDREGRIWISLWKNGLCTIDQTRKHITYIPKIGVNDNPFRVFQDKSGLYWICTWGDKIFNMTFGLNGIVDLHPMPLSKNSPIKVDDIVYSITQDDKYGLIWVVTYSGLNLIEKELDGTFKVMETNSFFDESANKLFHEIIKDRRGNLWVGSVGEGLFKLDFNKLSVQNYALKEIKSLLNVPSYVTRFCELTTGEVYIAINRIGLFSFNSKTGAVKRLSDPLVRGLTSISAIVALSSTNEVWAATEGEDLIHVFKQINANELIQLYSFPLSNSNTPKENTISSFFEDTNKNIWIGTDNGLYLKPLNGRVKLISSNIHYVNTIGEDINKKIWIGTEKEGVFVFKPQSQGNSSTYTLSKVDLNIDNYQSYSVQSICCQRNGNVYIGTKDGCLYYYDQKKKIAKDISGLYGISDEGIMDIIEDNYGMLWISTIKKIIKFNPKTHTATYFSSNDGMLISSFFKDARIKLKSGKILFGGNNGICMFNPAFQNVSPNIALILGKCEISSKSTRSSNSSAR